MTNCRLCGSAEILPLLDMGRHPIAHHFPLDVSTVEFTHPVKVEFCEVCGLSQITDPVPPDRLYKEYVCLSSWKLQPHAQGLAKKMLELSGIKKSSRIVEIGCNDGIFLQALRSVGFLNLLGIEPAEDAYAAAKERGFHVINDFFSDGKIVRDIVAAQSKCDIVVARQVLEHIVDVHSFLNGMVSILRPGGYVLIEVPDFDFNVGALDYTAIWEEHVNYFSRRSLRRLLNQHKISVISEEAANFSGQALIMIGQMGEALRPSSNIEMNDEQRFPVRAYGNRWASFCQHLRQFLQSFKKQGKKIAMYGAGNRACALINFVDLKSYLDFVVDDQKEKQGKFMPGSRLPILPPEALEVRSIDLCLLAVNAENEAKVISQHPDFQLREGQFVSLLPPSPLLPPFWKSL